MDTIGDVWVLDGVIEGIYTEDGLEAPIIPDSATVIDCKGKWVAPGLVDLRTFCGELGVQHRETFDTLTTAAMSGGYTDLVLGPLGSLCRQSCCGHGSIGAVGQLSHSLSCAGFSDDRVRGRRTR